MGVMNNLRENTGVSLWILVLSFGVIWTLQDSNVFESMGQQTRNIAVVNGSPIRYEEFQQVMEQQRRRMQQQFGNQTNSQRMNEMVRERTYTQLVNSELMEQEMDRLGVSVTDKEVTDMVFGSNPHPIIRRQFADSTGQINYELLRNAAQNPQTTQQWRQLEDFLRKQRRQQKMNAVVQATIHVSDQDVEEYYRRQNSSVAARYVSQRYASVPNDSIEVTSSDLRTYYESNREQYERPKTLQLEYIALSKEATAEDTTAIAEDLADLREEFAAAEDDSTFLAENASDEPYSGDYRTADEMPSAMADAIFQNLEVGSVVGPVFADGAAHLIKVRDARPAESEYVHARHILLRSDDASAETRRRLASIRDSIASGAAAFEQMARRYSDDGSASEGGDLGWFGRGRMVEAFEAAAFDATPGELVGPVRSRFGYHLIRVDARADQAVQVADLAYSLSPSQATLTELENRLEDVAYFAEEDGGSFTGEAERMGLTVEEVEVEAGQASIPGITSQSRAIATFTEEAASGEISPVFELDERFVLLRVDGIQPEGYRPFEQVEAQVRSRVELQKKKDVLTSRMARALRSSGFDGLGPALGTRTRSVDSLTYATQSVPGVGQDPAFVGTAFGLEEGGTSGVVEGENAAFVIRVTERREPTPLTAQGRERIRQRLRRQEQQSVAQQWIATLREKAEITDNRSEFQMR
jgi:peptidylprolyl isomerase/peptidyl-prolyl cis-trans isomerase D